MTNLAVYYAFIQYLPMGHLLQRIFSRQFSEIYQPKLDFLLELVLIMLSFFLPKLGCCCF